MAEGDGDPFSGVDNVDGIETVPASFGMRVGVTAAVGLGVAVEISTGVDVDAPLATAVGVGDGEAVGLSVGLGGCPNTTKAIEKVTMASPPARKFFRITN